MQDPSHGSKRIIYLLHLQSPSVDDPLNWCLVTFYLIRWTTLHWELGPALKLWIPSCSSPCIAWTKVSQFFHTHWLIKISPSLCVFCWLKKIFHPRSRSLVVVVGTSIFIRSHFHSNQKWIMKDSSTFHSNLPRSKAFVFYGSDFQKADTQAKNSNGRACDGWKNPRPNFWICLSRRLEFEHQLHWCGNAVWVCLFAL